MTSKKKTQKEIATFRGLVISHLARMIALTINKTLDRGADYRYHAAVIAITLCWRDRWMFQAPEDSWMQWYETHLDEVVSRGLVRLVISREEQALLDSFLVPESHARPRDFSDTIPIPPGKVHKPEYSFDLDGSPPIGKDCCPCWQCRYFDGWLPKREPKPVNYADADITVAVNHLNETKIRVAQWVREHGWET
jgi:hypothetical protein